MFAPEKITETCFPDENYKLEDLGENYHRIAAYVDGECAGFALTKMEWNKWLYLDNLLVLKKFRRAGVGLMTSWGVLRPILLPVSIVTAVTIITVMAATGWASQIIIRRSGKNKNE